MMGMEKLSNKIIAIGGAIAVIGAAIAYMGFNVESPTDKLDTYIIQSDKVHVVMEKKIDSVQKEVEHVNHIENLLEGLLRGECLENPRENLARQGLLVKCKQLGIDR